MILKELRLIYMTMINISKIWFGISQLPWLDIDEVYEGNT